jgi:hypothetical protein
MFKGVKEKEFNNEETIPKFYFKHLDKYKLVKCRANQLPIE